MAPYTMHHAAVPGQKAERALVQPEQGAVSGLQTEGLIVDTDCPKARTALRNCPSCRVPLCQFPPAHSCGLQPLLQRLASGELGCPWPTQSTGIADHHHNRRNSPEKIQASCVCDECRHSTSSLLSACSPCCCCSSDWTHEIHPTQVSYIQVLYLAWALDSLFILAFQCELPDPWVFGSV